MHFWSEEEKEWLAKHYTKYTIKEMLPLFNKNFNVDVTYGQLKGAIHRYKIRSGRTGQFEKGHVPANKGTKGKFNIGGNSGSFKKGQRSHNYKPIGSERIDRDGYVIVKVSDEGPWHHRWRHKHKVIWENANGPIPKGHAIIFLDQNKQNITLENLQLISKSQLAQMNNNKLFSNNPEITKTGTIIADIYNKIGQRKKELKED